MLKNPTANNKTEYKEFRNRLHSILRKAERDYYALLLENNKFNLRKTWGVIKEIINKRTNTNMPDTFIVNNKTVSNKAYIANAFNKYFVKCRPDSIENKSCYT